MPQNQRTKIVDPFADDQGTGAPKATKSPEIVDPFAQDKKSNGIVDPFQDSPDRSVSFPAPERKPKMSKEKEDRLAREAWGSDSVGGAEAVTAAVRNLPDVFKQNVGGLMRMAGERSEQDLASERSMTPEEREKRRELVKSGDTNMGFVAETPNVPGADEKNWLSETGKSVADEARKTIQENMPQLEQGSVPYYLYHGTTSVGQMAPSVVATILTGNPAVGAAMFAPVIAGTQYDEARREGRNVDEATLDTTVKTAAESLSEMLPLGTLTKEGGKYLWRVGKSGLSEGIQESVNEGFNMLYDYGVIGKETPPEEIQQRLMDAFVIGAGVGTTFGVPAHMLTGGKQEDTEDDISGDIDPTQSIFDGQPTEPGGEDEGLSGLDLTGAAVDEEIDLAGGVVGDEEIQVEEGDYEEVDLSGADTMDTEGMLEIETAGPIEEEVSPGAEPETAQESETLRPEEVDRAIAALEGELGQPEIVDPFAGETEDAQLAPEAIQVEEVQPEEVTVTEPESAEELDAQATQAAESPETEAPAPTEAQKEAGNYKKGKVRLHGMDISIENPRGSTRTGTRRTGEKWSQTMKDHYGYIRGTKGRDKDHVDVFVTKDAYKTDRPVFVVDQVNEDGSFDEHKVIMGAANERQARRVYKRNYGKGWQGMGAIKKMSPEEFKAWTKGDTTNPVALPAAKKRTTVAEKRTAPKDDPKPDKEQDIEGERPGLRIQSDKRPAPPKLKTSKDVPNRGSIETKPKKTEQKKVGSSWKPEKTSAGKIKGAPQWVNEAADPDKAMAELYRHLRQLIREGEAGRFWYENSAQSVLDMVGNDVVAAEQFIQLLAIYSPQANVGTNTNFAIQAWNQWKNGVSEKEFKVKTRSQDNKAIDVLYHNKPFAGRKTSSFYLNLMHEVLEKNPDQVKKLSLDPDVLAEINKPVTVDVWMYRAFGYENEAAGDDKGTGAYSFAENATRKLAADTKKKGDEWLPHQVQAASWTAMKARFEMPRVKERTWRRSIKEGHAFIGEDGKRHVPTTAEGKRQHLKIWREEAMSIDSQEAREAAERDVASFHDYIKQATEIVTWEAVPNQGQDIQGAPAEVKGLFTEEARSMMVGEEGQDMLAEELGVPISFIRHGEGAYEGALTPNNLTHLVPSKGNGEFSRKEVRAYARAIQYIFKQEAVPWFRPDPMAMSSKKARKDQRFKVLTPKGRTAKTFETLQEAKEYQAARPDHTIQGGKFARGVILRFDHDLTTQETENLAKLMTDSGFTKTAPNEIMVVNFRDDETGIPFVDDEAFLDDIQAFVDENQDKLGISEEQGFWAEGEYGYVHDWESDPQGQAIIDDGGLPGGPDLQARVRDWRRQYEALLDRYSGESLQRIEKEELPQLRKLRGEDPPPKVSIAPHAETRPRAGLSTSEARTKKDYKPGRFNPFPTAEEAARKYAESAGIEYNPPQEYAKVDREVAARIAHEFDLMEHNPNDPEVQASYDAMIEETLAQYQAMLDTGLKIEFIKGEDPYSAPIDAVLDVVNNNHLYVFSTRDGFGSDENFDVSDNPLLRETEFKISGETALANDIFRAVHDYFGHIKPGVLFRWTGEENAWQSHAGMYSDLARRAMTTETRGQNSWLNFGPHGEHNRNAKVEDTVFADQKIGLMPRWTSELNRLSANERHEAIVRENRQRLEGAINERGEIELVHYSRKQLDRTDPGTYGTGLSRNTRSERDRAQAPGFVKRTYFGIESAVQNGYRKETGLGGVRKVTSIDAGLLYPANADPLKIWDNDPNVWESRLADMGFSGYWVDHPERGKVAAVFDPLELQETQDVQIQQSTRNTKSAAFKRWFGDSKVVDENGEPLVVYHGSVTQGTPSRQGIVEFQPERMGSYTGAASAEQGFFFVKSPRVADSYTARQSESTVLGGPEQRIRLAEKHLEAWEDGTNSAEAVFDPDEDGWVVSVTENDPMFGDEFSYTEDHVFESEAYARAEAEVVTNRETEKASAEVEKANQAAEERKAEETQRAGAVVYPVYLSIQDPLVHDFQGGTYADQSFSELIENAKDEGNDGVLLKNVMDSHPVGGQPEVSDVWIVFEPTQIKSVNNRGTFDPDEPSITQLQVGNLEIQPEFLQFGKIKESLRVQKETREAHEERIQDSPTATTIRIGARNQGHRLAILGDVNKTYQRAMLSVIERLQRAGMPNSVFEQPDALMVITEDDNLSSGMHLTLPENSQRKTSPRGGTAVAARVDLLEAKPGDPLRARLYDTMAHEFGHVMDHNKGNGLYYSEGSPLFRIDHDAFYRDDSGALQYNHKALGPIVGELADVFATNRGGLRQLLAYPFAASAQYADGSFLEKLNIVRHMQVESFAQAASLYYTHPERLRRAAPQTYQLLEEIHNAYATDATAAQRHSQLREAFQHDAADPRLAGPEGVSASDQAGSEGREARRGPGESGGDASALTTKQSTTDQPRPVARLATSDLQRLAGTAVVDENGDPLAVYHGTPETRPITVFRGEDGVAWFVESRNEAAAYGDTIYSVYLDIKNPADIRPEVGAQAPLWKEAIAANPADPYQHFWDLGYDGIRTDEGGGSWLVRSPDQVIQPSPEAGLSTSTPEFKRWFGDSKVVNPDTGEPLRVYHGTSVSFDEFAFDGVHFFSDSQTVANEYAETGEDRIPRPGGGTTAAGGQLVPVYLSLQNPMVVNAHGKDNNEIGLHRLIEEADAKGHDGLIVEMVDDSISYAPMGQNIANVYVAFDSTQIKSAIGNRGTFDPNDLNILHSRRPVLSESQPTEFTEKNRRLREQDQTIWKRSKRILRRQLSPGGLLPKSVFDEKITRDSQFEVIEFDVRHIVGNFERAIKRAYKRRAGKLTEGDKKILSDALAGKELPEGLAPEVKSAVVAMRSYIDKLSREYTQILQRQIDDMRAQFDEGRQILFDAFMDIQDIVPASNKPADKAKATRRRNEILDQAKEQAKEFWGNGRQMQQALSEVNDAASRASLLKTVAGNVGKYVHRSYQAFDDPSWIDRVPEEVLENARAYLAERNEERAEDLERNAQELFELGHLNEGNKRWEKSKELRENADTIVERQMNEILKVGTAFDNMEAFIKEGKLGRMDMSVLQQRKEIPKAIRDLLGEYTDPRINFAKSATKMGRLIWNQRFLEKIQEVGLGTFLWRADDESRPAEAYVEIAPDSASNYEPLSGYYTYPEIEQAFRDALGKEQMANWYRWIVQMNGMVKYGKTVLSPTTAMRNWQSAAFFALANGHIDWRHAGKSFSGMREYFTQMGKGEKLKYLRKLKELGVVYDTPYAGEMMRLLDDSQMSDRLLAGEGQMSWGSAMQYATKFYQFGDDFWKIIGFENEKALLMKHANMSEQEAEVEAAERIRNTYPTYSMVGRFIQNLRRFPVVGTFVSFPAEIIRTSANMVRYIHQDWNTPGMRPIAARRALGLTAVAAFAHAIQALTRSWFDIDDDEEEALRIMSAPWSKNSNIIFTGRDEDGNLTYFDLSFLDPYNIWKRPVTAAMRDEPWEDRLTSALGDTLGPFLGTDIGFGAISEVVYNKRNDNGGPVYPEKGLPWDQIKAIVTHVSGSLQPGLTSNIYRTWQSLEGTKRPSGRPYKMEEELLAWGGWRASTLDPKVSVKYLAYDFTDQKRAATSKLTRVLRDPNEISDEDIRSAVRGSLKLRNQAYDDMVRVISAAKTTGATEQQIEDSLRSSNVALKDIRAMLRGHWPYFELSRASEKYALRTAKALYGEEHQDELVRRYKLARDAIREREEDREGRE